MRRRWTLGRSGATTRAWCAVLAGVLVGGTILAARADILHLKSGGSVEGEIIEQDDQSYKLRTIVGTITVPREAVERVETKPSILAEYEQRRRQAEQTPAAQFELAQWCEEHELRGPARKHLKHAIELDPNFEPARTALGHVRVGGVWVDGSRVEQQAGGGARGAKDPRERQAADEQKIVAAIQAQWNVQIRSIRNNMLHSSSRRLRRAGRERITAIQDPLAILPLTRVLGEGNHAAREALVEALSHFPQDEATMNLAIVALTDADDEIRTRALAELKRRDDPRVIPQFRQALTTDNDALIRRAAMALGASEATSAIPELIDLLTARRRKPVEISTHSYFQQYPLTFGAPFVMWYGHLLRVRHYPTLPREDIGFHLVRVARQYEVRDVTVFRTEVLEALKAITGQNFGFDEAAWRRWYEEQQP